MKKCFLLLLLGSINWLAPAQPTPTGVPSNLVAQAQTSTQIDLTWRDNTSAETGYEIERGTDGRTFTKIGDAAANATSFQHTGLLPNMHYYYRIRAVLPRNTYSGYSNTSDATTPSPPPVASDLNATARNTTSVELTWSVTGKEPAYSVERRTGQSGNFNRIGAGSGTYMDNTALPGTEYCYRVQYAEHTVEPAAYSNIACATTAGVPPVTPGQLSITSVSSGQLQLFWTDINVQAVTFEISRADNPGGTYKVISSAYGSKIYDDKDLPASTQYCYKIRARNSAGLYSGYSNEACGTTKAAPVVTPLTLAAQAVSASQINLSWNPIAGVTGYQLERSLTGADSWTKINEPPAGVTTYSDQTVLAGTRYFYRIRTVIVGIAVVYGTFSSVVDATTPRLPSPINNLKAVAISSGSIKLTWDKYGGKETSLNVERRTGQTGTWSMIATVYTYADDYVDAGLQPNTEYCYRLMNLEGAPSDYSDIVCATTQAPAPTVPDAPIRLSATAVAFNQINLFWAIGSVNTTGFEIEQSSDGGTTFNRIATVGVNVTTYQHTGLNGSTKYYYRVRATNAVGPSGYSNVADAVTPAAPEPPPSAPTGLVATAASSTQINLSWTNTATNATGYAVEQSPDGTGNWTKIQDLGPGATSYENKGLTPATRYYYRVRAVNQGGGNYSNVADALTIDVAPGAPARLVATAVSSAQIDLTWADGSGNETGFEIEQSVDGGTTWSKLATVPMNTTTYPHKGLKPVTRYFYRVRAINAVGPSPYADPANATTFDVSPGAPANLVAQASSFSAIGLTWTNSATNVTGIDIEQSLDGNSFQKIGTVGPTATTYTATGLTPATRYYYHIRAVNTAGGSDNSNVANAITPDVPPQAPARLTAQATSYSAVSLTWADASGNETGFDIEQSTDGTTFNRIATVGANVTTYANTGLNGSTKYYYRVRAVNAIGSSGYAGPVDVTTPQAPLPGIPTNLTAVPVDFDLIKLTWNPVSANTTSVVIERSTSSTGGFVEIGKQVPTKTDFGDVGVLPIATYYYRIKAVNAAGSSDYSNVAKVAAEALIDGTTEPAGNQGQVYVEERTLFVKLAQRTSATIQIVNLQGVVMLEKVDTLEAGFAHQYPLNLPAGLYIVAVQTADAVLTKKIMLP